MKTSLLGTILLALVVLLPVSSFAGVDVNIGISLPPLIPFPAPPHVVVLPDTDDVYVAPDVDVDIYFWNGLWWRPWEGRWYRSRYYDRGWVHYRSVPVFYREVSPNWRRHYRDHDWYGHRWTYERIPHKRLDRNWKTWHDNRYWERHKKWDVQNYKSKRSKEMHDGRHQRQMDQKRKAEKQHSRHVDVQYRGPQHERGHGKHEGNNSGNWR